MVRIEANFDVKLLFFSACRHQHANVEAWKEGCLQSISSATSNGGEKKGDLLQVTNREGSEAYDSCVRSYACWDPSLLTGATLLNSQTSRMDRVSIEDLGEQTIDVRGMPTRTDCRRIVSGEFTIVLWYVGDDWVALDSTIAGGDRL